jgi:ferredoxin
MIITEQKPFKEIADSLKGYAKIFLVGCGECSTTCKSGGQDELLKIKAQLEEAGKSICGMCVPQAPCMAPQIKAELAKNMPSLRQSEAILVLACGLGTQSVKDNLRLGLEVLPALNSISGAVMDARGDFYEKCSMCGDCVLGVTAGICPITLCAKGLLNGPCGGMNKGKCEVDKDKDCAWVLIYNELDRKKKTDELKKVRPARDFKKALKPHKLSLAGK